MSNGIFTLDWVNIKSALVSGLIMAVLAMIGYVIGIGDIFKIDVHAIVNIGVLAGLGVVQSLVKNLLTTNDGKFVGKVEIKPAE